MTESEGVCANLRDSDTQISNREDGDDEMVTVDGVTVAETSDFLEESGNFCDYSGESSKVLDNDSDVIHSYIHNTTDEAEARLWAKRQARAEAREIRMRELERQQKEQEENADRQFDMLAEPLARTPRGPSAGSRYLSSRRSSEDSLEDGGSLRELRTCGIIWLEELEEEHSQLKREHREKCREHEQLKRLCTKLQDDLAVTRAELEERDRLIAEKGLIIVGEEVPPDEDGTVHPPKKVLVSIENAQLLEDAGDGSLDDFTSYCQMSGWRGSLKEKSELQDQISHLKLELEEERSKRRKPSSSSLLNGPFSDYDYDDIQREASKQLADYKFRAQKAEQDVATLQATVARLESQVIRYKTAAEVSEQSEEALKAEKRKLQREARDALSRAEELETSNTHLLKRLDKLKNAKSALLKEL
ncbi:hypothetical protein NQ317_019106 [Molorchus minor]|uniref:Leucine-rich repeat flightless-interacting protein 2 n=1 Tax=Molorchus minor TaxID=1323400 RepID=A0ABQ9JKG4_9CUCU|nr:hypothetical protein NQ317_019106 [Molorchus minor]